MKKRQLKIRFILFVTLAAILGLLILLYFIFCRGKGYNNVKVDLSKPDPVTPEITEIYTEPVTESLPEEQSDAPVTEEPTAEESTAAAIVWSKYNPLEVLGSENWSLTLINKTYLLDKTYSPTLAPVIENSQISVDSRVAEAYQKMYNAAKGENIVLTPYAGYCSYNRQKSNFDNKVNAFVLQGMSQEEATSNAEKRIGFAGSNESGAGLSVDIVSASAGFASTDEFKWLTANAHNYGFVLRYPEDKVEITGFIYQPWHWRYVGVDAATEMKNNNQCLEEYLGAV